jgi:hypothetical protein
MENTMTLALSRLTNDWQALSKIKLTPSAGARGFADLVWEGRAEVKRVPVSRGGRAVGEVSYYRIRA